MNKLYEKFPTKCNVCGKKVIVTNSQVVLGKLSGKQLYFYCDYCKASAPAFWNEEEQLYEAFEILTTKKMRIIQKEILKKIEEECTSGVPEKYHEHLKNLAYKIIADYLEIAAKECYIKALSINQLNTVLLIMERFWEPFICEKRRILYFTKEKKKRKKEKSSLNPKENIKEVKVHTLTEEDKKEIKKQAAYIMKGKNNMHYNKRINKRIYEDTAKSE